MAEQGLKVCGWHQKSDLGQRAPGDRYMMGIEGHTHPGIQSDPCLIILSMVLALVTASIS